MRLDDRGKFTLKGKNRQMKSIIRRLFFCYSRIICRWMRNMSLCPIFPARCSFERLFKCLTVTLARVIFRGSAWLSPDWSETVTIPDKLENLDDNYSNTCRNWDNLTFFCCVATLPGASGNEMVYPVNLQFIRVSEKLWLLWHKKLMSRAEWSKLTPVVC